MRYRQNVEAELAAMLIAIALVLMVATGTVWAVATIARWALQ